MGRGNVAVPQRQEQAAPEGSPTPDGEQCRHHWLIESAHGATSRGLCKICGSVRDFRNSLSEGYYWEGASEPDLGRWGHRSVPVSVSLDDEDEMSVAPRGELALTL